MRVRLSQHDRHRLFIRLRSYNHGWRRIAMICKVSTRTIRDWQRGRFSIPGKTFEKLCGAARLSSRTMSPELIPEYWHTRAAGRIGGLLRADLYGNFGTPEGRRRGGFASLVTHKQKRTGFNTLRSIVSPIRSEALAECMGVMIGDGHLSKYQASVTTNSKTDQAHAVFIRKMFQKLFQIPVALRYKKNENAVDVVASSRMLVEFLHHQGMPIGNKIHHKLRVPLWIFTVASYQRAFLRGLFDTDGCVFLDIHRMHERVYKYLGWTITSYAGTLTNDIVMLLRLLGFSPTHRATQKSVYLRRQKEIARYFEIIGTHNSKHRRRYRTFVQEKVLKLL